MNAHGREEAYGSYVEFYEDVYAPFAREMRVEDRIEEDIDLSSLAALIGISESHLCRAFKASTGLPPYRWLAERRMARAKASLADPKLSLTEVAQAVGYSGQNTFGEAFRRATGASPARWRRERTG